MDKSTIIPDIIFDKIVPLLPVSELRVYLYICKRTFGEKVEYSEIGLNQFIKGRKDIDIGCGLGRTSVIRAIKNLEDSNFIIIKRDEDKGRYGANSYAINLSVDTSTSVPHILELRTKQRVSWEAVNGATKRHSVSRRHAVAKSKPNSYTKPYLTFYIDACKKLRGVNPTISVKDRTALKRVLDQNLISHDELEQITIYFLSYYGFSQFSPTLSVMFSGGILTSLMNSLKNKTADFWKHINYAQEHLSSPSAQQNRQRYEDLKKKMLGF